MKWVAICSIVQLDVCMIITPVSLYYQGAQRKIEARRAFAASLSNDGLDGFLNKINILQVIGLTC